MRACIAALLDLNINDVPHFAQLAHNSENPVVGFWDYVYDFLAEHGYDFIPGVEIEKYLTSGDLFHLISGPSPRDKTIRHVVIGLNGKIFFDPHPSRAGLSGEPHHWMYSIIRKL
jgi:hypothetical protein